MTILMAKGSVVLSYSGRINPMNYFTYKQSRMSDFFHHFDSTKSKITYDSLVTSTNGYRYKVLSQINNLFYYWNRQRCFRHTDPYNPWRLPEKPENCSRADIARAYRLGSGF